MDEHELTTHVLEILDQMAYRNCARRILSVHLAVGGRRGFDLDRLQAVFCESARGTVADGAELRISILPVRHHCQNCGCNFEASNRECACPQCNHPHTDMMGGEELRVLGVDLDDTAA